MKVAGVMQTTGRASVGSHFYLRDLCDETIVLQHNPRPSHSLIWTSTFKHRITLRTPEWDCVGNKLMLMMAAHRLGCDYVVMLDDDMLPSEALVDFLKSRDFGGNDVISCKLCDLWGDETRYRTDGVWGRKTFSVILRNWLGDVDITLPPNSVKYHHVPISRRLPHHHLILDHGCRLYHYGSMTRQAREARVAKYKLIDPDNKHQEQGYDYILDETGLQTEGVPPNDAKLLLPASEWRG